MESKIFIKGMVCNRCIMTVTNELERLGYAPITVRLGEATLGGKKPVDKTEIKTALAPLGFDLIEDRKLNAVNEVKSLVARVYSGDFDFPPKFRFANLIKERYAAVSEAFIETEKKTIEQYIIEFRLQKVKELLVYSQLTLADIAFKLNFNSTAHLSTQFKQQTGLTPSYFRQIKTEKEEIIHKTS
jgi:AraC family transcriptional regulator